MDVYDNESNRWVASKPPAAMIDRSAVLESIARSEGKPVLSPVYPDLPRPPSPQPPDPKALMAASKLPILSVLPPASIIHEAVALEYGAFHSPRTDGTFGYGPYNYRTGTPVEVMTYIDACMRHVLKYVDGEDMDPDTRGRAHHLGMAKASLGILLDAMEHKNTIDNRPGRSALVASRLLTKLQRVRTTEGVDDES